MAKSSEESQKSFLDYISNKYATEALSMFQRGVLQTLKYNYAEDPASFNIDYVFDSRGRKIKVSREVKIAFSFIKNQMDINADKYQKRCEINKENGARGGRPRKDKTEKTERFFQEAKKADNGNDKLINENVIISEEKQKEIEVKKMVDYQNILMDAKRNKKNQIEINKNFRISIEDIDFRDAITLAGKDVARETEKWIKEHFLNMKIGKNMISSEVIKFMKYMKG